MQLPPIKTIEAVVNGTVDYRAKRSATHFRHFFRCFDKDGEITDDVNEIVRVELTQRGKDYHEQFKQQQEAQRRPDLTGLTPESLFAPPFAMRQ